MKFKIKSLLLVSLSISMLLLSGCGNDTSNNVSDNSNNTNTTDNSAAENSTNNNSNNTAAPTNEEYYTYLTDRYNYYFDNYALDTTYDM